MVMSGRSVNLTKLFLDRLKPCTYFGQSLRTALLELVEGETKVCGRAWYRTRDPWLLSQTRYRLRYAVRQCVCVCVYQHSHVSGGKFYLEKIIAIFSGGNKTTTCTGKCFHTFRVAKQTFIPTYMQQKIL